MTLNINIGDLINQTGFTHYTPRLQVRFGAPKGRVSVMLLLGDADKKAPDTFDAKAALNGLGWIEETALTAAQSELAAQRLQLARCAEQIEEQQGELAALREELYVAKEARDTEMLEAIRLQQRLTAAEQRNAVMADALQNLSALIGRPLNGPQATQDELLEIIWLADKPTESGASE